MTLTLQNLIDDGLIAMLEGKALMNDVADPETIEGDYFAVDLSHQTITFGPASDAPITARAGWIGSCTPTSWMWGWNNINNFPPEAVADATLIRQFGEQYGVAELTTPQIALLEDGQRDTVWKLAAVASLICGRRPMYFAATSETSYGVLLVDRPDMVPDAAPDAPRLERLVGEAVSTGYIVEWPRALRQYAALRGLELSENGSEFTFNLADEQRVVVELNERALVKSITMRTPYRGPGSLDN